MPSQQPLVKKQCRFSWLSPRFQLLLYCWGHLCQGAGPGLQDQCCRLAHTLWAWGRVEQIGCAHAGPKSPLCRIAQYFLFVCVCFLCFVFFFFPLVQISWNNMKTSRTVFNTLSMTWKNVGWLLGDVAGQSSLKAQNQLGWNWRTEWKETNLVWFHL